MMDDCCSANPWVLPTKLKWQLLPPLFSMRYTAPSAHSGSAAQLIPRFDMGLAPTLADRVKSMFRYSSSDLAAYKFLTYWQSAFGTACVGIPNTKPSPPRRPKAPSMCLKCSRS
jgi:hypothetical protein